MQGARKPVNHYFAVVNNQQTREDQEGSSVLPGPPVPSFLFSPSATDYAPGTSTFNTRASALVNSTADSESKPAFEKWESGARPCPRTSAAAERRTSTMPSSAMCARSCAVCTWSWAGADAWRFAVDALSTCSAAFHVAVACRWVVPVAPCTRAALMLQARAAMPLHCTIGVQARLRLPRPA